MNRLFQKAMDPISSETHFIGACLSTIGLVFIILLGIIRQSSPMILIATVVFGISLIALYSASATYHFFNGSEKIKLILRKLDHSMIYILIVGTYTPVVVYCMKAPHSYYFLGILWTLAIIGILVKVLWINAPRMIGTLIYLLLGWSVVFDFHSFQGIPIECLTLIAIGGIMYSIGAIIYIIKKPNLFEKFQFHELFHIFVMLGSFFHYIAIIHFIL